MRSSSSSSSSPSSSSFSSFSASSCSSSSFVSVPDDEVENSRHFKTLVELFNSMGKQVDEQAIPRVHLNELNKRTIQHLSSQLQQIQRSAPKKLPKFLSVALFLIFTYVAVQDGTSKKGYFYLAICAAAALCYFIFTSFKKFDAMVGRVTVLQNSEVQIGAAQHSAADGTKKVESLKRAHLQIPDLEGLDPKEKENKKQWSVLDIKLPELIPLFKDNLKVYVTGPFDAGKSTLVGLLADEVQLLGHELEHTRGINFYERKVKGRRALFNDTEGFFQLFADSAKMREDFILDFVVRTADVIILTFNRLDTQSFPILERVLRTYMTLSNMAKVIVVHNVKGISEPANLLRYVEGMQNVLNARFSWRQKAEKDGKEAADRAYDVPNVKPLEDAKYVLRQQFAPNHNGIQRSVEHYFLGRIGHGYDATNAIAANVIEKLRSAIAGNAPNAADVNVALRRSVSALVSKYCIPKQGESGEAAATDGTAEQKNHSVNGIADGDNKNNQIVIDPESGRISVSGFDKLVRRSGTIGSTLETTFRLAWWAPEPKGEYDEENPPNSTRALPAYTKDGEPLIYFHVDASGIGKDEIEVKFNEAIDGEVPTQILVSIQKWDPANARHEFYTEELKLHAAFPVLPSDKAQAFTKKNSRFFEKENVIVVPLIIACSKPQFELRKQRVNFFG